ncbi:MAG: LysR family transcriptional regulator [Methylobacteriaceae bacterium]|nr:LysR family transcriptional regulator [Methylobacteriaceae bacterium]
MTHDPSWDLHRSFLAVIREGSLSAAARSLGLTQPTVGRHVDELEALLKIPLFTRSQRGLEPTAGALELVAHAEAMAAAADALVRAASGEAAEERGTVRITASEVIGNEVLPQILAAFREMHPGIVIELVLSNRTQDLLRRDADIAVRMMRPSQDALVARHIGPIAVGLYAHKAYADRHPLPRDLGEIVDHPLIGFDRDMSNARIAARAGFELARDDFAFRCDSDVAQLAALRAGFGIGGCQLGIARRDPNLVPVLPESLRFELDMWLAMHEDLRSSRRVRLLFDHLAATLSDYVAASQ